MCHSGSSEFSSSPQTPRKPSRWGSRLKSASEKLPDSRILGGDFRGGKRTGCRTRRAKWRHQWQLPTRKRLQLLAPCGTLVSPSSAPALQKPLWSSGWVEDSAALLPSVIELPILTYPSELGRHLDLGCSSDSGGSFCFPRWPRRKSCRKLRHWLQKPLSPDQELRARRPAHRGSLNRRWPEWFPRFLPARRHVWVCTSATLRTCAEFQSCRGLLGLGRWTSPLALCRYFTPFPRAPSSVACPRGVTLVVK